METTYVVLMEKSGTQKFWECQGDEGLQECLDDIPVENKEYVIVYHVDEEVRLTATIVPELD